MTLSVRLTALCVAAVLLVSGARPALAQSPELGQGWSAEFDLAARQILQLANATPEDKFAWRPAPGVRSISEVYVHTAMANLMLLERGGIASPPERAAVPPSPEKAITAKADVIAWLEKSFAAVRKARAGADLQKQVKLFGRETTAEGVFIRILVHNHEHMGQAVAYARMNGIAPPWSGGD